MTELACLALVMYMESSISSKTTQEYVGSVVIERAYQDRQSICKNIHKPISYAWMFDGKNTKVDEQFLQKKITPIAERVLKKPRLKGYYYFNECRLGKRFKTKNKMIKSDTMCFY
jgi:hypothetical protein